MVRSLADVVKFEPFSVLVVLLSYQNILLLKLGDIELHLYCPSILLPTDWKSANCDTKLPLGIGQAAKRKI